MNRADNEFRAWIDRNGTEPQWRAVQTAYRSPRALRDANLRNRKAGHAHAPLKAKSMAFTLNETTAQWLKEQPPGTMSATVEIAIAQSRLFFPMLKMIDELLEKLELARLDPAQSLGQPSLIEAQNEYLRGLDE